MGMNMNKMMKQVQKMQQEMARVQEEEAAREVSASAGGGAVTVTVNGKPELVSVSIEPDLLDPADADMLQDLIVAASNEALRQSQEQMAAAMARLTGGMKIPGLPGF